MRKLTVPIAAAAVVAAAGGITMVVVDPSPTSAAPNLARSSCGSFDGFGPAPDCGVVINGKTVRVELRNNGVRPIPVVCTLGRVGAQSPTASTTMGPGARGVLSATSALSGGQAYVVDCQSAVPVAKEISRTAVFTAHFAAPERTTSSGPRFVRPAPPDRSTPTLTVPRVRPSSSATPTVTTPTVTTPPATTTREFRPFIPRPTTPSPDGPDSTTTTTTTPAR
ncbi:hypothetical protein [Gordonia insulae]|uniref:Uncharacterized protein n=1 Tax=Gordonia insulae TaxID=2420509 RepID=A0A3G8JQS2_9ACTN|nr:hypothetical protein [Gordonia insulae]AZG47494.1 hypothetical protein D7316_04105 [Gordonia insulae]